MGQIYERQGKSSEAVDYYRRFDPNLSDSRRFIEVFDHRPMINLSLMTDYTTLGLAGVFQKPLEREHFLSVLKAALAETGT